MNAVVEAAYALAASRGMCCRADLDLLLEVMGTLPPDPVVVQLGAGSGTMALAIMGSRDDLWLTTVDHDPQALAWEQQALKNAGVEVYSCRETGGMPCLDGHQYEAWNMDSAVAAQEWQYVGLPVDLVIVDADHSFDSVIADVYAWRDHCGLMFIHDYDGTAAPRRYPGVRQACDAMWGETPPLYKAGWSAVFVGGMACTR